MTRCCLRCCLHSGPVGRNVFSQEISLSPTDPLTSCYALRCPHRVMHEALLSSLLRAPMSFYHTTPAGRIINRLTKDTADIDRNLAGNLSFAFRWGFGFRDLHGYGFIRAASALVGD